MKYITTGLLLMLITGCAEESILEETVIPSSKVKLALDITLHLENTQGDTRADDFTLNGSDMENIISNITLFVVDLDGSKKELWNNVVYECIPTPNYANNPQTAYTIQSQVETTVGSKHIYVGANMTMNHINAFVANQGKQYSVPGTNYQDMILDLIGKPEDKRGIVMTGMLKNKDDTEIEVVSGNNELAVPVTCDLERVVAKVLLICKAESGYGGKDYVIINNPKDPMNPGEGWMRLDDVAFSLNTVNRQIYLMQQKDVDRVKDPNYLSSDFVELINGNYQIKDRVNYEKHFIRQTSNTPVPVGNAWMPASKYDASKQNKNDPANYHTEGLYCTENTMTMTGMTLNEEKLDTVSRFTATMVVVAGRFVPGEIITENGNVPLSSPAESDNLLPGGTDIANGTTYPQGTFWFYDSDYYSYAGMLKTISDNSLTRDLFTVYTGGWGYYSTYIDGNLSNNTIDFKEESSGVLRNYYYILNVESFNVPGNSSVDKDNTTMKIHLEKTPWIFKGKTTITIDPSQ